jgi:hypothetical protein
LYGESRPRLCENEKRLSRECDALRFDTLGTIRIERTAAKLTSTFGHFGGSMSFHTAATRSSRSPTGQVAKVPTALRAPVSPGISRFWRHQIYESELSQWPTDRSFGSLPPSASRPARLVASALRSHSLRIYTTKDTCHPIRSGRRLLCEP